MMFLPHLISIIILSQFFTVAYGLLLSLISYHILLTLGHVLPRNVLFSHLTHSITCWSTPLPASNSFHVSYLLSFNPDSFTSILPCLIIFIVGEGGAAGSSKHHPKLLDDILPVVGIERQNITNSIS